MNSIVIYICHEVFEEYFPLQFQIPDSHAAHLGKDIWGAVFWVAVSAIMYYKKVFIAL
jgi:heparan-alpha-glucosaminide N-acetyltransferase